MTISPPHLPQQSSIDFRPTIFNSDFRSHFFGKSFNQRIDVSTVARQRPHATWVGDFILNIAKTMPFDLLCLFSHQICRQVLILLRPFAPTNRRRVFLYSISNFSAVVVYNKRKSQIFDFIEKLMTDNNRYILFSLVRLWQSLSLAADAKPSEEQELRENADVISKAILQLFRCDSMDMPANVDALLVPSNRKNRNNKLTRNETVSASVDNEVYLVTAMHFLGDRLLAECLENDFKAIFGVVQVSNMLDLLFVSNISNATRSAPHFIANDPFLNSAVSPSSLFPTS